MTAVPWNIRGSASQLYYQDKQSPEYQALLSISDVPHPQRSMLGGFINNAADPQKAARYFLSTTAPEGEHDTPSKMTISQFLIDWKLLAEKCKIQ